MLDGFMMGSGLALVLGLLGGMREIIGKGTLFSGLDLVFGVQAKQFVLTVIPNYQGFLLAVLPPGAFLGLGTLIALRNWAEIRKTEKASTPDSHLKPALNH
jgi:electron transport complex protein RnfE